MNPGLALRDTSSDSVGMKLATIKEKMNALAFFHSEESIQNKPTAIAYEKKFKWIWFATQLNTFIVAIDYGEESVSVSTIEAALTESFQYARRNYRGWPRGFQSGVGVITILLSSNIDEQAATYCREMKAGKKWAGFAIPVTVDTTSGEVHAFRKYPMWGRIYFPHFKRCIEALTS